MRTVDTPNAMENAFDSLLPGRLDAVRLRCELSSKVQSRGVREMQPSPFENEQGCSDCRSHRGRREHYDALSRHSGCGATWPGTGQ